MHDNGLWCHATGPEHRDLSWRNGHRVAKIWSLHVANANGGRIANVHRRPMHCRKATGDLHGSHHLGVGDRAHADDHRPLKDPSSVTRTIGNEHRHIHAEFNVSDTNTCIKQRMLKGKTQPSRKLTRSSRQYGVISSTSSASVP